METTLQRLKIVNKNPIKVLKEFHNKSDKKEIPNGTLKNLPKRSLKNPLKIPNKESQKERKKNPRPPKI